MKFYHGSPQKGIKVLEPKLDPRLGIKGIFVADEPYGPMMFSLLQDRAQSIVNYKTEGGKFIEGEVISQKALLEEGWLYTVDLDKEEVSERKPGRYHLTRATKVSSEKKVTKEEVLTLGWKVTIKNKD